MGTIQKVVFLCTACADYATKKINDTVPSQEDKLVKQVVNIIKTNNISENNITKFWKPLAREKKQMLNKT